MLPIGGNIMAHVSVTRLALRKGKVGSLEEKPPSRTKLWLSLLFDSFGHRQRIEKDLRCRPFTCELRTFIAAKRLLLVVLKKKKKIAGPVLAKSTGRVTVILPNSHK